jgi:membrane-bound metal-dependent hydrolase YbcI (DUF457 family)
MFFWFVGGSWVIVWAALQDPAVDYRLVMLGAILPDVIDAPLGGARVAHTLVFAVGMLLLTMVVTIGRRRLRRRLLGVPIGIFVHLILDGMWTQAHVFWWPLQGRSLTGRLPSLQHPVVLTIAEEVVGVAAIVWCIWRFRLTEVDRRRAFVRTGRIGRDVTFH